MKKHKNAKALPGKMSNLTASEFSSLVKRYSWIHQKGLRLPEVIRSKFGSFAFTDDNALELWKYLAPVARIVKEFHGDATKYYMNLYGLLHESLLSQKFAGDITVTSILLSDIENYPLIHYAKRWHRC